MAEAPFKMSGQTGSRDKVGIVTWTVPYYVETFEDIFTVGDTPPIPGLVEVNREWSDIEGCGVQVDVTYSGDAGLPTPPPTYEFDPSFREETLLAHPEWQRISSVFNGRYDKETEKIIFDEFLSSADRTEGAGGLTGALGAGVSDRNTKNRKNPFFGLETFLDLGGVFRITYTSAQVPGGLLDSIGEIRDSLPHGFPTPPDRNWMLTPPRVSQEGNTFKISEEWMLSPRGGWPPGAGGGSVFIN